VVGETIDRGARPEGKKTAPWGKNRKTTQIDSIKGKPQSEKQNRKKEKIINKKREAG